MEPVVSARRRWWILAVVGLTTLMGVLDASVMTIALPHAQADLGFSSIERQWIVTAYALSFGSLLLFAGRLGDVWGRRRLLVTGLLGFAVASAAGGLASSYAVLVSARAAQGLFGALLAPAALATVTTTFIDARERGRALAIYGAIGVSGASIGLLLGGVLTQWATWRWCLSINVGFAVLALVGVWVVIPADRGTGRDHLDWWGAVTGVLGLFFVVYGLGDAETAGWGASRSSGSLTVGLAVMALFIARQRRVREPLLPLALATQRTRAGSLTALFLTSAGLFGLTLFLSYYFQVQWGATPVQTGIYFLPLIAAISLSATLASARLWHRVGPRPLLPSGMLLAMMGSILLTRLSPSSSYVGGVLPGVMLVGLGLGMILAPAVASATALVDEHDAGAVSALVGTMQQIGGSIGTALLNAVAVSATAGALRHGASSSIAVVQGYDTALWWVAGAFGLGAVLTMALLETGQPASSS